MNSRSIASVATCLGVLASPAAAQQTFTFGVAGTGIWETSISLSDGGDFRYPFEWSGEVAVTTSGGADGEYSGFDVLSLVASGHINSEPSIPARTPFPLTDLAGFELFSFDARPVGDGSVFVGSPFIFGPAFPGSQSAAPVVTISGGVVTSIQAAGHESGAVAATGISVTFSGLDLGYFNVTAGPNSGIFVVAQGVLTPVPEPETWALFLAGIAAVAAGTRGGRGRLPGRFRECDCA